MSRKSNVWLLDLWTNDYDYAIAMTEEEAVNMAAKYHGYEKPWTNLEKSKLQRKGWYVYPSDKNFGFALDDNTEWKKTALEWVTEFGRGYFSYETP